MKQIRIWKLFVFNIITLGFYSLYWFASIRNELVKNHNEKLPHWLWIVLPMLIGIFLFLPTVIAVFIFGMFGAASAYNTAIISYIAMGTLIAVPYAISIWWVWKFSKAIAKVTGQRVPAGWAIAIYIFNGPWVTLFQQYYLNRIGTAEYKAQPTVLKPSTKFQVFAVILIGVSLATTSMSFESIPNDIREYEKSIQEAKAESTKAETFNKQVADYSARYTACIDTLNKAYPDDEVAEEDATAYSQQYEECEQIRLEQEQYVKDNR